jgi:hypothetical protein
MKLPPWDAPSNPVTAKGKRDKSLMVRWVNRQLDYLLEEEMMNDTTLDEHFAKVDATFDKEKHFAWVENYGPEIEAAEHGIIKPLLERLPHLARFLRRPKRPGRGQHFKPLPRAGLDPVAEAVADVKHIQDLWQKHYGKKNRSQERSLLTAEEIAAHRWSVTLCDISNRKKRRAKSDLPS